MEMRKIIILFCFIFCISCSERKADSNKVVAEQQKAAESPFNPALRKAINEFIDVVENKCVGVKWKEVTWEKETWERIKWEEVKVYWLHSYDNKGVPALSLRSDYWYFDWPQYYYIDGDHLILYSNLWDENNYLSGMIDVSKMTEFRDSIPGFNRYPEIWEEHNLPVRTFEIVSPDSLRTMHTELTGFKKRAPRITPDENL